MFTKLTTIGDRRLWLFRLAALTALVGSGLAIAKILLGGQCDACTAAKLGPVLGALAIMVLPWLGLAGSLTLLSVSYGKAAWVAGLRQNLSLIGGGAGLGFFLTQAVLLRSFCPTCCLVNASFLLAALIDASGGLRKAEPAL